MPAAASALRAAPQVCHTACSFRRFRSGSSCVLHSTLLNSSFIPLHSAPCNNNPVMLRAWHPAANTQSQASQDAKALPQPATRAHYAPFHSIASLFNFSPVQYTRCQYSCSPRCHRLRSGHSRSELTLWLGKVPIQFQL